MCVIALMALGWWLWTAFEYALHRFIGHTWHTRLRTRHLLHHSDPLNDGLDPKWSALSALLLLTSAAIATWLLSLIGGMVLGYCCYELTHWWVHHDGRKYWRHLRHHEDMATNYGVTTRLFDVVFRTAA